MSRAVRAPGPRARWQRGDAAIVVAGAVVGLTSFAALVWVVACPAASQAHAPQRVNAGPCMPPAPPADGVQGVIASGREDDVLALLRGDGPALTFESISVSPNHITARVAGSSGGGTLMLLPRGASPAPLAQGPSFDIECCGCGSPDAAAHARRIAARDDGGLWSAPVRDEAPRSRPQVRTFFYTLGAALAIAVLLSMGRMRARTHEPLADPAWTSSAGRFAALAGLAALVFALYALSTFRFAIDDFSFLMRALEGTIDDRVKWLSVSARFRALQQVGSAEWAFATSNLLALGATSVGWAILLRRAGCHARAAVLAGALFAMGPGSFLLLRWASGFEHLSAHAYLVLVLLLTDVALRARVSRRQRAGAALLACCVASCAVFTKPPLMPLLPAAVALWAWGGARARLSVALASSAIAGAVVALTLLACGSLREVAAEGDTVGRDLPGYFASWWAAVAASVHGPLFVLALVLSAGMLARLRSPAALPRPGAVFASALAVLRDRAWLALAAATLVAAAPFILQGGHFPEYYALISYLPIAAALGIAIASALERTRVPWWGAAACVLLVVPVSQAERNLAARDGTQSGPVWAEHGFEPWLGQLARETRSVPAPAAVLIRAACEVPGSREDVEAFSSLIGDDGIRWTTGWHDADVVFQTESHNERPAEGPLVIVEHCRGAPPRVSGP